MNQAALMVEGYELEVCKCCGLIVLRLLLTSLIYLYSRRLRWTAVTMKVCVVSRIIMIMIIWYLCCAASDMSCFCRICYWRWWQWYRPPATSSKKASREEATPTRIAMFDAVDPAVPTFVTHHVSMVWLRVALPDRLTHGERSVSLRTVEWTNSKKQYLYELCNPITIAFCVRRKSQ